ncbi:rna-directed dna polymerase from mobile element jockey- hypothetical protein [Limosa lapponica baueri]|uniref:Uncharacterized protein n=1 Tax=Limosa lapponica baueri TaxID=1758121 RepID=A0A2I0U1U2_LIMLA|nr:rna-directed dna polymerase from mobile element jockey- hypothetical protein [Limosa lapponica baueri]
MHLEYCVWLWAAQYKHIDLLERSPCEGHEDDGGSRASLYEGKLSDLELLTLEKRKLRQDIINVRNYLKESFNEMEQILLDAMLGHMEDRGMIQDSQHGFTRGKSCLTNLVAFYDEVTSFEVAMLDMIYCLGR